MKHSELVESLKNNILTNELSWEEYDSAEFLIKGETTIDSRRVKFNTHCWLTNNGEKGKIRSVVEQDEYKTLFIENKDLFVLQIFIKNETMQIYGNVALEKHGIDIIEEFKNPKEYLVGRMNPYLEKGCIYVTSFYTEDDGIKGMRLFEKYVNGVKQDERVKGIDVFDEADPMFPLVLEQLTQSFNPFKKTQVIAQKDQDLVIKEFTTKDIINDIKTFYDEILNDDYWIECDLQLSKSRIGFKLLDIKKDNRIYINGQEEELFYFNNSTIELLYRDLDQSICKLKFTIKNGVYKVYADKAFPEFGIEIIPPTAYDIAPDDIEMICRFIESGVQEKIDTAVEVAYKNNKTLERIEQRYLYFVKAQLENQYASLRDITEDMFSEETKKICLRNRPAIGKDYISFGYKNENESKLIIDFIGSIVESNMDVKKIMREIDGIETLDNDTQDSLEARDKMYSKYQKALKRALNKEAKLNVNGWWSKSCKILAKLKLKKVLVEKSDFYELSKLPFLEAYMFYINVAMGKSKGLFDIYNSEMHDLSQMYWRFRNVPDIIWFQSKPSYPAYPYKHDSEVLYRIDNEDFKRLDLSTLME